MELVDQRVIIALDEEFDVGAQTCLGISVQSTLYTFGIYVCYQSDDKIERVQVERKYK